LGCRAAGFAFGALLALGGNVDLARFPRTGHPAKEPEQFNAPRSKLVSDGAPAPTRACRFSPIFATELSSRFTGSCQVRGLTSPVASPESRHDPRSVMSDQILLQFEVIRMIAAALVAVAIAIAWVLAVGK
jgi:hypothetical protein